MGCSFENKSKNTFIFSATFLQKARFPSWSLGTRATWRQSDRITFYNLKRFAQNIGSRRRNFLRQQGRSNETSTSSWQRWQLSRKNFHILSYIGQIAQTIVSCNGLLREQQYYLTLIPNTAQTLGYFPLVQEVPPAVFCLSSNIRSFSSSPPKH